MSTPTFEEFQQFKALMERRSEMPEGLWHLDERRKRAPVFTDKQVLQVERHILAKSNIPAADLLKFWLTVYAGLRVAEVSGLLISDLFEQDGTLSKFVTVRAAVGKAGRPRKVPMHQKIGECAQWFRRQYPQHTRIALSKRWYRCKPQGVSALTNYMIDLYAAAGLPGHSTHSGRRTFITNLAKNLGKEYTLRDVQFLAGHAQLSTTEQYIELSSNIVDLVGRLK